MIKLCRIAVIAALVVLVCGCGRAPAPVKINVIAPDYLQEILVSAADQFKEENGTTVNITFVKPDSVSRLAKTSMKADLFITGDSKRFVYLMRDTLLADSNYSCPFRLSMVLVGREDGPRANKLENLTQENFRRVAVLDPTGGMEGKLAARILNRHRLWDKLIKKLIVTDTREHLRSFLATGEVDAAVIFESTIGDMQNLAVMMRLDDELGDKLVHCGAVIPQSANKEIARAFLDLLDSRLCRIYNIGGIYQSD